MANLNEVLLIGTAGKDAELSYVGKDGKALCKFSLATNAYVKGQGKGDTTWHNIVCWQQTAEIASSVRKGDNVLVKGSIITEEWMGQDGSKKSRQSILGKIVTRIQREKGADSRDVSRTEKAARPEPPPPESDVPF